MTKQNLLQWPIILILLQLVIILKVNWTSTLDQHNGAGVQIENKLPQVDYDFAVSSLRCLTTPGCFPSFQCRTGTPMKVMRDKKWEEQSFCVDDLLATSGRCLVYSFGIHESWDWEEKMARIFGCEVHAFDPTMDHPTQLAPNVTFHKLGLQGDGANMAETHAEEYDAINPDLLLTLPTIMDRIGHSNRNLDVLMLDCEGCEWGALKELACSGSSSAVGQIMVEAHFQKKLGLNSKADVRMAADAVTCLERENWGMVSMEKSGAGHNNWEYEPGVLKVIKDSGFLMYMTLQRRTTGEPSLESLLLEKIAAERKWYTVEYETVRDKYGEKEEKWPESAKLKVKKARDMVAKKSAVYGNLFKNRFTFDEHQRFNDTSSSIS